MCSLTVAVSKKGCGLIVGVTAPVKEPPFQISWIHCADLSSHLHFAGVTPFKVRIYCEPLVNRGQVPVVLHFLLLLTSHAAFISVINIICVYTL